MNTYPALPSLPENNRGAWSTDHRSFSDLLEPKFGDVLQYRLPAFQRAWAWDDQNVCDFLMTMFKKMSQTPLVLWKPRGGKDIILLDGQHRLVSLGATVVDHQGSVRPTPKVRFDVMKLQWEPGEGDNYTTFDLVKMMNPWPHSWLLPLAKNWSNEHFRHVAACTDRHTRQDITVVESTEEESPESWSEAVSYFERMLLSVPFSQGEFKALRAYSHTLRST